MKPSEKVLMRPKQGRENTDLSNASEHHLCCEAITFGLATRKFSSDFPDQHSFSLGLSQCPKRHNGPSFTMGLQFVQVLAARGGSEVEVGTATATATVAAAAAESLD